MRTFYHVDRLGTLSQGNEISLTKFSDITPPELQGHVDRLFPEGFSNHGDTYLLKNNSSARLTEPNIELIFEYIRRSSHPEKISRYQSFFGCATLQEAQSFRSNYGNINGKIWEVEADVYHIADMSLLRNSGTALVCSYLAELYWAGEQGPGTPVWEVLMAPPVRIIQEIP